MNTSPAHILITRPVGQEEELRQACLQRGLGVSHIPCLQINSVAPCPAVERLISSADVVLFTSVNAVRFAHKLQPMPWPAVRVHAIGKATASLLNSLSQALDTIPLEPYSSEAYLQQLSTVPAGNLLLIKGLGGRELIRTQLLELGWTVNSWEVYRRSQPSADPIQLQQVFSTSPPDIISVTSDECLSNLLSMASHYQHSLLTSQLIVNSKRCASLARSMGFRLPALVASPAGDEGQLEQLDRWLSERDR